MHLTLTYVQDGKDIEIDGDVEWAQWEVNQDYEDIYSDNDGVFASYMTNDTHTLKFRPKDAMVIKVSDPPERAVREILLTAEIQASGSTVAALEEAREAVGAPADALVQIDRWSYPEAIEVSAKDPVKVRFTWREER